MIFEGEFSREDENEADKVGVQLANKVGYAPAGPGRRAARRSTRATRGREDRNGMFASHPATKDRIAKLEKQITAEKLAGEGDGRGALREAGPLRRQADHRDRDGRRRRRGPRQRRQEERRRQDGRRQGRTARRRAGSSATFSTSGEQAEADRSRPSPRPARAAASPTATPRAGPNKTPLAVKVTAAELEAFKKGIAAWPSMAPQAMTLPGHVDPGRRGHRRDARRVCASRVNRLVRRKLRLSLVLLVAYLLLHLFLAVAHPALTPAARQPAHSSFEQLALAAALINLVALVLLDQPAARRSRPGALPDHPPGRDRHRRCSCWPRPSFSEQLLDHLGGQRGRARLRAAGHARQRLRRPGDPEREAVPRRPVDSRRRTTKGGSPRSPGARPSCAPSGQLRHPPNNVVVEGSDHQLLGAGGADAASTSKSARSYRRRPNQVKAAMIEALAQFAARADGAGAGRHAACASTIRRSPTARASGSTTTPRRAARDEVRTAIYYAFARHGIEIPWPIQVEYAREWDGARRSARQRDA